MSDISIVIPARNAAATLADALRLVLVAIGLANGLVLVVSASFAWRRGIANLPLDAIALGVMAVAYTLALSRALWA